MKARIRRLLLDSGAVAVRFARCAPLPSDVSEHYHEWIASGCNADMAWMSAREELHADPERLLPGCRTVASLAFPYGQPAVRGDVSVYAYGADYHDVIRGRLRPVCRQLEQEFGCKTRICVDSAPIAERYWAVRSGLGFRGENGCVIVPGEGSQVFLAEVLLTAEIEADEPLQMSCLGCKKCVRECPGGALSEGGEVDARRCVSYLTIEHRGTFDAQQSGIIRRSGMLFGCDACQRVCPHNNGPRTPALPEFLPAEWLAEASRGQEIPKCSPMSRTGREGILRNRAALEGEGPSERTASEEIL